MDEIYEVGSLRKFSESNPVLAWMLLSDLQLKLFAKNINGSSIAYTKKVDEVA